jgi:hypothetical protein
MEEEDRERSWRRLGGGNLWENFKVDKISAIKYHVS